MKNILTLFIIVAMILFIGCAGAFPVPAPPAPAPSGPSPCVYLTRAMEYEKDDELHLALRNLEVANRVDPQNEEVRKKIGELKTKIQVSSETHFEKGVKYYKKKFLPAARKEFLTALRYNPDHEKALLYVKTILQEREFKEYKVEAGDTLRGISRKTYNDPEKEFLIVFFNDVLPCAELLPGSILRLPVLEPALTVPKFDAKKELKNAKALFRSGKYKEAISVAGKIMEYDTTNKDASNLINASYYKMGKRFFLQKKYYESLKMFEKADPNYRDIQNSLSDVKEIIKEQANGHYRMGVKYFVNEKIVKAIKEWEQTLTLMPDHQKAKRYIKDARDLLERLKNIK